MKIGQITNQYRKIFNNANYLQLDICGCSLEESIQKYKEFNTSIPIILHGDWNKKGFSENNLLMRKCEYIKIINYFYKNKNLLGFTIHPPFRKKIEMSIFLDTVEEIKRQTDFENIFIENRSGKQIHLSKPEEIINLSQSHKMTIDVPQLYISCNYDNAKLIETLNQLYWDNIIEIHFANIVKTERNTFVGRRLDDGLLDLGNIIPLIENVPYITFEILGGEGSFNDSLKVLKEHL